MEYTKVFCNGVHYDFSNGTGSYGSGYPDYKLTYFKFKVPKAKILNIENEILRRKLDTIKAEVDFQSEEKYSNPYGIRLLAIEFKLKDEKPKIIGYSGLHNSKPEVDFIADTYEICNSIKDSLKIVPFVMD